MDYYKEILIIMALFIFIVNQANILYGTFYIDWVTRRTRKIMLARQSAESASLSPKTRTIPLIIQKEKAPRDWSFYRLEWKHLFYAIGGLLVFLLLSSFTYIFGFYNPNP